jgi:hypothetical protein
MKSSKFIKTKTKACSARRSGKKLEPVRLQDVDLFGEPITDAYFAPRYASEELSTGWGKYSRYGD